MKILGIIVLSIGVLGGALLAALATTDLGTSVHEWSHRAGLCPGEGCLIPQVDPSILEQYSDDEITVIRHIADQIVERGTIEFTAEDGAVMEEATGLEFETLAKQGLTETRIQMGVLAELQLRRFDISSILGASHCARFSACSIDRDLSGADGAELARYEREKAEDGKVYENLAAPDFSLPSTTGETISLSDYRGRPVAVAFLAGHCHHCLQTLPVLDKIQSEYATKGLIVLPVYVNSGSVEDIKTWSERAGLDLPLLVSEEGSDDKGLSEDYDFRMVPSVFLIDENGMITRKLVGQKSDAALQRAIAELIAS